MKKIIIILFFCCRIFSQEIKNAELLNPFFDDLTKTVKITQILHVGDSHIKGKFFTDAANEILLEKFGNSFSYEIIAKNGAKASDYSQNKQFFEQISQFNPDLLIISFGTNEAFNDVLPEVFLQQIDTLVAKVLKITGEIPVLITTPPLSFRNGAAGALPGETNFIHEYAENQMKLKNYAIFDLHSLTHDLYLKDSENKLFRKDKVHYTADGYKAKGNVFAKEILRQFEIFTQTSSAK